jgi:glutamate/tyrosine decarboxylase-like PLP-dependent enzyme
MGERGYLEATRRILEAATRVKEGIAKIDGLAVIGDPLWNVAFTADDVDVYRVLDVLGHHGWSLNGLQDPASIHLCVTLRHTQPGVVERFLADLRPRSKRSARTRKRAVRWHPSTAWRR